MSSGEGIRAIGSVAAPRGLLRCPHCEAPAIIRRSERVTPTVKHMGMICTNETCGHTWLAQISPVYTICPSQVPNPEVHIPDAPTSLVRWHSRGQLSMFEPPPDPAPATTAP